MEELLRDQLEKVDHPQTLSELLSSLPSEHQPSEVKECLVNLIKKGVVVSKALSCDQLESGSSEGDHPHSSTLYWIKTSDQQLSELATPAKCSALLSTPLGSGIRPPSQRSRQPFKSPAQVSDSKPLATQTCPSLLSRHTPCSSRSLQIDVGGHHQEQLAGDVLKLRKRLEEVEGEIAELAAEGCQEAELQAHINALHDYNEIKDTGQLLLGKMAELEGTTTTSLYERFGLELDN